MRAVLFSLSLATLAGCSDELSVNRTEADINAIAADAQGDIDTYAANRLQVVSPVASLPAPTRAVAAEVPAIADLFTAGPVTADGAKAAADVVRSYHVLIEARSYAAARRLWGGGGRESGMSEREFADPFAGYASYHAQVGIPGRIDAGAGQWYVVVPVRVSGTLAESGRPFAFAGSMTLHRTADIEGATAEQRSWRISDSSVGPSARRPAAAAPPAVVDATYRCAGETRVSVRFDNDADTASIRRGDRNVAVLAGQRPASGIWYRGEGYELRGKGRDAHLTLPGRDPQPCQAERAGTAAR